MRFASVTSRYPAAFSRATYAAPITAYKLKYRFATLTPRDTGEITTYLCRGNPIGRRGVSIPYKFTSRDGKRFDRTWKDLVAKNHGPRGKREILS